MVQRLAEIALSYAEELARVLNSEVILLYVGEPAESQYLHMHQLYIEKMAELVRSHVKEGTRVKVKSVTLLGEPAQEIIKFADETNIRLVAISSYGHSGIRQWIFGSVTHKILQASNTPALMVISCKNRGFCPSCL